jgi:hypothetical protein
VRAAAGSPLTKFVQELTRRHKERIVLQDTADDYHRMRPHNVNHRVASELPQMISADDRVVVMAPHVVHTRLELNHVVDKRSILTAQSIRQQMRLSGNPPLAFPLAQLLKYLQHPILIEAAIWKVNSRVDPELQLPALLRRPRIDARGSQASQMVLTLLWV